MREVPEPSSYVRPDLTPAQVDALQLVAARTPGLELLVLHGSRARGEAHERSDYDLAYLGDLDRGDLDDALARALGTDVDLGDLASAGAVFRRDVASQGLPLHERVPGAFLTFRERALSEWADLQPLLTRVHREVLDEVARAAG